MKKFKADTLIPEALAVLQDKATEAPNTGQYNLTDQPGTYLCRQCGLALFRSTDKFIASCGWPSFDDEIKDTIKRLPDADGRRTEILCNRCDGHLGHVFHGEQHTDKNLRHCVNALSIDFVHDSTILEAEEAIFAAGCFWGVQTLLEQNKGVVKAEVGYTGGTIAYPTYEDVCTGQTGHIEAIRVLYDPKKMDYETLAKDFFSIHDPTQVDGQGPDHGYQYKSATFVYNERQAQIAQSLIEQLTGQGLKVATEIKAVDIFWPAEDYHQDYYAKTGKQPYCHARVKRFD